MASQHSSNSPEHRGSNVFHETLAPTAEDYSISSYTAATSVVQLITTILNTLLIIRFFISLLSADRSIPLLGLLYSTTDWLVSPFAGFASLTPLTGTTYIDWPAFVGLIVVSVVSALVVRLTRTPSV